MILLEIHQETVTVANWVMSCRVLKRTVENAILDHVLGWSRAAGIGRIEASFVRSPKNMVVAPLYDDFGFARVSEQRAGATYRAATDLRIQHFLNINPH